MSVIQIVQLIALIWQLLKALQKEDRDPTGEEVKETAVAVATAVGSEKSVIDVIASLPADLLAEVGKLLAGK